MDKSIVFRNAIAAESKHQGSVSPFMQGKLTAAVSLLFISGFASGSFAQNVSNAQTQKTEEVVITGTMIRGVTPTGSPVIGLSAKDIQEGGYFNATDVLRSLPQVLNLGATDSQTVTSASNAAVNQVGSNGINLRGLGTPSTLTLINGHRTAQAGGGVALFDASSIPSMAISKLDVLVDGTSALYGSDAVAGVVNILLKRGVDGASTQFSIGATNDVRQWSASQLFGKVWETGSLTATVEHTYRKNVFATTRPNFYDSNPYDYGIVPLGTSGIFSSNPANIIVTSGTYSGITCSSGAPCYFPVPTNQNGSNLTTAALSATPAAAANKYAGANLRNSYQGSTLLPEQKRDTLVLVLDQAITDKINFSGDVLATKRRFLRYTPGVTSNLLIPKTNPYSPCFTSSTGICSGSGTLTVPYYFGQELGLSINKGYSKNTTASAGLDFDLIGDWHGNLSGTYSKSQDDRLALNTNNINPRNPDTWSYTGPNIPTSFLNNFNPFIGDGSYSASNQALVDKNRAFNDVNQFNVLKNVAARVDGSLFELPGGNLRAALGAEHRINGFTRTQTGTQLNGSGNAVSGLSINAQDVETANPPSSSQSVNSAYTELFIPVIGDRNALPFIQKLDISLAGRYEKNSRYGSSRTPKLGFTWALNDEFQINGTAGKSFRAPSLVESDTFQGSVSCYSGQPFCSALVNFNGAALTSTQNVMVVGGGNPDLIPETAKTKTLGFSWRPKAVKGLDLTVSYYDINYTNRISGGAIFGQRTDALSNPIFSSFILAGSPTTPPTAAEIAKWAAYVNNNTIGFTGGAPNPANSIVAIVDGRLVNAGKTLTNGFDLSARYAWDSSIGRMNAGFIATLVNSWKVATSSSSPSLEYVNTNADAYPLRFRGRGQLGWHSGPYGVIGTVNYTNSYTNNFALGTTAQSLSAPASVSSYTTLDLNTSYDFGKSGVDLLKNLRVQVNVQNLFDRAPPYARFLVLGFYSTFDPQNASAIGRQISMQVTKDW